MSLNDVAPEGGAAIARGLRSNASITELTLVRCGLGPGGGKALGEALATNTTVRALDITQNDLGVDGGVAFGKALAVNSTLHTLSMRFNRIGFGLERATAFAEALEVNTSLTFLDMAQNELGKIGAAAFARALAKNSTLRTLHFERNELLPEGRRALGAALAANVGLTSLNVSQNELGEGAAAFRDALASNRTLTALDLSQNGIVADGCAEIAAGVAGSPTLGTLILDRNVFGDAGGEALAAALRSAPNGLTELSLVRCGLRTCGAALAAALPASAGLRALRLSRNDLDDASGVALCDATAAHPTLHAVDLSSNAIGALPIECQLRLAHKLADATVRIDLSGNLLTSPPLAHRADPATLGDYLRMLAAEPRAVSRVRCMVVGFGGVGKTTFCRAATCAGEELSEYHASLIGVGQWTPAMIASWARGLATQRGDEWAAKASALLAANGVAGADLAALLAAADGAALRPAAEGIGALLATGGAGGGAAEVRPSAALEEMCAAGGLDARECRQLALAICSLLRKGYFSTVGAVKVEGELVLTGGTGAVAERRCSLVDFAGQMEYLVSHQLLLASMHTLCVVIQPEGSHADATSKHHGSWRYWLQFLAALGDRRTKSMVLASSQLDRVPAAAAAAAEATAAAEFASLRAKLGDGLGEAPTRLDYRPDAIAASLGAVVARLSAAADAVSSDWWVPASYEHLAAVVGSVKEAKARARALPILSRAELVGAIEADGHDGLRRMCVDPLMLQRGIDYLEAVGDVMSDGRLDVLLLDPVGWFAGFLAHFIRDDGNPPAEVVRGVVSLPDVVAALRHEYLAPETQVPEVMALVCNLELCVELSTLERDASGAGRYLFPCLLPAATPHEIALHWPRDAPTTAAAELIVRGHRFRASGAFLPPGVFPSLVARLARLPQDWVRASRLWKDAAVLHFQARRCSAST